MIAAFLMLAAQDAPASETVGRAFPARQLACTVTTPDNATFAVTVKEKNGVATLKSARENLLPSGVFAVSNAFIARSEGGKPVDYRVSIAGDREAGHYSLGLKVEGGVVVQAWLRLQPAGQPQRSDLLRAIGSEDCTAEKKS